MCNIFSKKVQLPVPKFCKKIKMSSVLLLWGALLAHWGATMFLYIYIIHQIFMLTASSEAISSVCVRRWFFDDLDLHVHVAELPRLIIL